MDKSYIRYIMLGRGFGKTQAMIQELINKCEQLEKALDKACEEYVSLCEEINNENLGLYIIVGTKEEWKEYLLKEVQEDEQIKQ